MQRVIFEPWSTITMPGGEFPALNPFIVLRNIVSWIADRFVTIHNAVSHIPLFGSVFGDFFYAIAKWLFNIATSLLDLALWYETVTERISTWLTSFDVLEIMSEFISKVKEAWTWIANWWNNVTTAISTWWTGTKDTVLSWVQTAKDWATALFSSVENSLASLRVKWDNFWTVILPNLASKIEVNTLIVSFLAPFKGLFNFWTTFGKQLVDFFDDPFQWIYDRLDHFFERFW